MTISFLKYHGAGNDFIMIDSRDKDISFFSEKNVSLLCNRHTGIGADGLILLQKDYEADFRMKYYNSDGREGTMCGNGGRCITAFARKLGIIKDSATFAGIDGIHKSTIDKNGNVNLKMIDVSNIKMFEDGYLLDTGSMHFVIFRKDLHSIDVYKEGKELRYQDRFGVAGTNVNFVSSISNNELKVRTYERGVENETLACGTGAVASAISSFLKNKTDKTSYLIHASGGDLYVRFETPDKINFKNIWLEGPTEYVFSGEIKLP